jgi:hypothetical protein
VRLIRNHKRGDSPLCENQDFSYLWIKTGHQLISSNFFSVDSVKEIVKNTEEYAATVRAKRQYMRWFHLTVKELYAFLGIIIFMGLVDVPTIPE